MVDKSSIISLVGNYEGNNNDKFETSFSKQVAEANEIATNRYNKGTCAGGCEKAHSNKITH